MQCTFCEREVSDEEAIAIAALSQTSLWPARMDALASNLLGTEDAVLFCTDCILEDATDEERQAIIDAMDLIDDAIVKPLSPEIQPQFSSVDRPPYTKYALWHFHKAAELFGAYQPEIEKSLEDFDAKLDNARAKLRDNSKNWGFTYDLPPWRDN